MLLVCLFVCLLLGFVLFLLGRERAYISSYYLSEQQQKCRTERTAHVQEKIFSQTVLLKPLVIDSKDETLFCIIGTIAEFAGNGKYIYLRQGSIFSSSFFLFFFFSFFSFSLRV